jgi:hypothetical protein
VLGQVALGRRRRGAAFFVLVAANFALGLLLGGTLPRPLPGEPLSWLGAVAMGATGLLGVSAWVAGWGRAALSPTHEAGTAFLLTSGIMGLLLLLDALERGRERP